MENIEIETSKQTAIIEGDTGIVTAQKKRKPPEEERLWGVLSHITLGIIGIVVLAGGVKTVVHSKFTKRHALTALFNGIAAVVVSILWYYIYVGVGLITGEQVIYDVFRIGMLGLITIFFFTAVVASFGAAKGVDSKIPWAYPLARRIIG